MVLDRGHDVAQVALITHNAQPGMRVARRFDGARGFMRRELRHKVIGRLAILLRKARRQFPHRHPQRVAFTGNGVDAIELGFHVPVRVHGA